MKIHISCSLLLPLDRYLKAIQSINHSINQYRASPFNYKSHCMLQMSCCLDSWIVINWYLMYTFLPSCLYIVAQARSHGHQQHNPELSLFWLIAEAQTKKMLVITIENPVVTLVGLIGMVPNYLYMF